MHFGYRWRITHRLNVAVIGLSARHWETYFPSFGEVGITLGITAAALFAFGWLARILPIHEELPAPQTSRRDCGSTGRRIAQRGRSILR